MGVKGLYSLLSNEPSRFGYQWSSTDSLANSTRDIYIDGPALHHHLIHCFRVGSGLPPTFEKKDLEHYPSNGVLSPYIVYTLTRAFTSQLVASMYDSANINCASTNIIFVFDGVAPVCKEEQQVERIKENCLVYDTATRFYLKNQDGNKIYHTTHLFSEDAMIEAVEDEEKTTKAGIEIHHAQFEAEVYIANLISQRNSDDKIKKRSIYNQETRQSIVLSNDSDFLVYPSVPGFIPLHSLQYRVDERQRVVVMGWNYLREKFLAAFPMMRVHDLESSFNGNDESLALFSSMAALGGCDYQLPPNIQKRIESARKIIVKSNIGGLRQRERRDPSAQNRLLAVLRYISHFRRKCQSQKYNHDYETTSKGIDSTYDWIIQMSSCITKEEGKRDITKEKTLIVALSSIKNIYDGRIDNVACALPDRMVDLRRLILHRTIYMKPVMEFLGCKETKYKKPKGTFETEDCSDLGIERVGMGGSLWMDENVVRLRNRLYSFLGERALQKVGTTNSAMLEYCRRGGGTKTTSYSFFEVTLKKYEEFNVAQRSLEAVVSVEYLKEAESCIQELQCKRHLVILLTTLLLDQKNDVLLFLMLSSMEKPPSYLMDCKLKDLIIPIPLRERKQYIQSSGRISVAFFHAKLGMDIIETYSSDFVPSDKQEQIQFHHHYMFCSARMNISWSIMSQHLNDENANLDMGNNGSNILSLLWEEEDRMLHSFYRTHHTMPSEIDRDSLQLIWQTWLKVRESR